MTYIDITDVNLGSSIRPANLKFNNNHFEEDFESLYLQKFTITSQSFPVFLPTIKRASETPLFHPPNRTYRPTPIDETSNFYLDWAIAIEDTILGIISSAPVKWKPQKDENLRPSYNETPTRREILTNTYFWAYNSIHVLSLIQDTINDIIAAIGANGKKVLVVKNNGTFQILVNDQSMRIFVNKPFRQAFNFYYTTAYQFTRTYDTTQYQEIVVNYNTMLDYGNDEFFVAQVLSLSSRLFPFTDIQFTSSMLAVNEINMASNLQSTTNVSTPIIFTYSLNITDIDSICDRIYYTATANFRESLLKQPTREFDIQVYFRTFDNYLTPLLLDTNDSINILFQFNS